MPVEVPTVEEFARLGIDVTAANQAFVALHETVTKLVGRVSTLEESVRTLADRVTALEAEPTTPVPSWLVPGKCYLGIGTQESVWPPGDVSPVGEVTVRRGPYTDINGLSKAVSWASKTLASGVLPWPTMSPDSWASVAAGNDDSLIGEWLGALDVLGGPVLLSLSHEPLASRDTPSIGKKGTADEYVEMMLHVLDMSEGYPNVTVCPVMSGYPWNTWGSWSDENIDLWLPRRLLDRLDLLGVDIYHGGTQTGPGDPPAKTMRTMEEWSHRAGYEGPFGLAETGTHDAAAWDEQWTYVEEHPRWAVLAWYHSSLNLRPGVSWMLEGERLATFQRSLASDHVARLPQ